MKLAVSVLFPSALLVLVPAIGLLAAVAGWWRLARRAALVALAALSAVVLFPLDDWLLLPLENRFPLPQRYPPRVDGVVVLGNGPKGRHLVARDEPSVDEPSERFTALVELGRRFPEARLVFTGGAGAFDPEGASEAEAARVWYERIGFPTDRILFEDRAHNTWENARNSLALARPRPGEVWLLVTSARDMPRAYGAFRTAGWDIRPWPVDYVSEGRFEWVRPRFAVGRRLMRMDLAAYEWYGLAWYYLLGRIGVPFPGPEADPDAGGERDG